MVKSRAELSQPRDLWLGSWVGIHLGPLFPSKTKFGLEGRAIEETKLPYWHSVLHGIGSITVLPACSSKFDLRWL
jgi:hypothetical protein